MKHGARFPGVHLLVLLLLAPACRSKPDDDAPRRAPAAAPTAEPRVAAAPPPSDDPDEPPPPGDPEPPPGKPGPPPGPGAAPPGGGPAPAGPGAGPPSIGIPFTPYKIPWPLPLPGGLPQIPGLPALPRIPGLPGMPGGVPGVTPPQGQAQVVMYGANWCPACKQLKADLARRKVPYTYVDVDDPKQQKSGGDIPANQRGGIPVTRVTQRNGQVVWVKGSDGARIEQAYRS